jgi:hypothetical protein
MYTLSDVDALSQGRRVERWRGVWFHKRHPPEWLDEFRRRHEEVHALADEQMAACRIFVARTPDDRRRRERLEAAVMEQMHKALKPICDIPEYGMMLAQRWPSRGTHHRPVPDDQSAVRHQRLICHMAAPVFPC